MSIYSQVESGTNFHRSRFTKSISNTMKYDCRFHELIPVLKRFVLPGDIWKIGGDVLVRFHPMMTPSLTPNNFRVRYFFVPLRLLDSNCELILTGSQNGQVYSGTLPTFDNFVAKAYKVADPDAYKVKKYSFWDYMGVQCIDYEPIKNDVCLPANYWFKAYNCIYYHYYADENISSVHQAFGDFESWFAADESKGCNQPIRFSELSKDYFTSSLPWQLKGVTPRIDVTGTGTWTPGYTGNLFNTLPSGTNTNEIKISEATLQDPNGVLGTIGAAYAANASKLIRDYLNQPQSVAITNLGFTADDLRTMMAQTRIFERLARAGSRYTEYLRANFGTSPADDTLQRPQYLGGWKVPIVTTEVLQTAQDGTNPVGTMRGHGITRGGNRINTFFAKEFGVIFGLAEIRPNVEYTTGIPREFTYKSRFDFFNPSFQHLSEQEVRKGELFISNSDGQNDNTFGFQAYANELRSAHDETVGDLRDGLKMWTQSLTFSSRPNLNNAFIDGESHLGSFNQPFSYLGANARPCIVMFRNNLDVYRPMVRYGTPGLVDHL